jgi:hypothetical protein
MHFLRYLYVRLKTVAGFDVHILHTLLFRGWNLMAGALSVLLIPFFLSPTQQGFYYTFASILALQVFFELGLNQVIIQLVSHEAAHLTIHDDGTASGEAERIHRLNGLSRLLEQCLFMGNLDALRDWGHAKDYVRMQWMMLQQPQADDFAIATGVQYSVRQFIQWSAEELGVTLKFEGKGVDETATVAAIKGDKAPGLKVGDVVVKIDPRYFRPTEVETLLGDPSKAKAKAKLGWAGLGWAGLGWAGLDARN